MYQDDGSTKKEVYVTDSRNEESKNNQLKNT